MVTWIISWILNPRNYPRYLESTFSQFSGQILIQWQKLSWIDTQYVKFGKKTCQFQGESRVPGSSRKITGIMEFLNFSSKIKFLDKIWVGKIPYILNFVKPSQIQGIPGFLDAWVPGFKNPEMLPKALKIIMIML